MNSSNFKRRRGQIDTRVEANVIDAQLDKMRDIISEAAAKKILQEKIVIGRGYLDRVLLLIFGPSLDFSIIVAMKDEARWMMDNNLTW